jgi:N utilization substance protein B
MSIRRKQFSPKARAAARQRVLQAVYQWQLTGCDIQTIESQFFDEQNMRKVDAPYFKMLLHGITEQVEKLDPTFVTFLDRNITQLDPIELAILRIGCYEFQYCPDVPYKVVINEAVELAKKFGATQSHKYINGILDKSAHRLQKLSPSKNA